MMQGRPGINSRERKDSQPRNVFKHLELSLERRQVIRGVLAIGGKLTFCCFQSGLHDAQEVAKLTYGLSAVLLSRIEHGSALPF